MDLLYIHEFKNDKIQIGQARFWLYISLLMRVAELDTQRQQR
jgi:hypothetical protein